MVSKKLGLPIKWIEDRSEAFVATTHGRDIIGYIDVAARKDGKVLGLKMRLIADIGAYNMLLTAAIPTLTMLMANGTYDIPAIRTTLTRSSPTRRRPTRIAAPDVPRRPLRRARDGHAGARAEHGSGGVARKNFIKPNQFPYQTQMGAVYDRRLREGARCRAEGGELEGPHRRARQGAQGRPPRRHRPGDLRRGLRPRSVVVLPTGGWEHGQVTVERDGRITATTGASPHGQGNETTFAQMLADQFSVPFEHVTILHGDTGVVKQGIGTFGSRSQAVAGTALHRRHEGQEEDGQSPRRCSRPAKKTSSSRTGRSA